jgi:hypothetical protein
MDSWIPTPERLNALCDAALQVEASEKSVEYWREQTSNANKQAGAMREAIKRAVADLKRYYDHQAGKNYHQIRSDLEQSLNPKNEVGEPQNETKSPFEGGWTAGASDGFVTLKIPESAVEDRIEIELVAHRDESGRVAGWEIEFPTHEARGYECDSITRYEAAPPAPPEVAEGAGKALFLDLGDHELCRFPETGEWSLRIKQGEDVAHLRYLLPLEVKMVEAALRSAPSLPKKGK